MQSVRKLLGAGVVPLVLLGGVVASPAVAAYEPPQGVAVTQRPIGEITLTDTLGCGFSHYQVGAGVTENCGVLANLNGEAYGPAQFQAQGIANTWKPVNLAYGTPRATVQTESGVQVTQGLVYNDMTETFTTTLTVKNDSTKRQQGNIYTLAECMPLPEGAISTPTVTKGGPTCTTTVDGTPSMSLNLTPKSKKSSYLEGSVDRVLAAVTENTPLVSSMGGLAHDAALALSWPVNLKAGASAEFSWTTTVDDHSDQFLTVEFFYDIHYSPTPGAPPNSGFAYWSEGEVMPWTIRLKNWDNKKAAKIGELRLILPETLSFDPDSLTSSGISKYGKVTVQGNVVTIRNIVVNGDAVSDTASLSFGAPVVDGPTPNPEANYTQQSIGVEFVNAPRLIGPTTRSTGGFYIPSPPGEGLPSTPEG